MPFYEYECQNCKFYTELMQKITDPPLTKCPSCGKKAMQKLISAPVFRLKGSGWYETDFKSDNESKRNLAGAEKEETKSEASADSASGKSESKADAKTESKPTPVESKPVPAQTKRAGGSSPARSPARTAAAKAGKTAAGKSSGHARPATRPTSRPASKSKAKPKAKAGKGRR